MKLKLTNSDGIQTSDNFKNYAFAVKSSSMGLILEILRSKIYKNPIGAICREVSSNARDANREVGKRNKPIEIGFDDGILSPGDLTIFFKDDGPGISPDRMGDVFVNYGESTKRDTNTQTGGFGLGAKTPFAYSDIFSIITIVDGIKYTYIAAVEQGKAGAVYETEQSKTDESNGTTIVIPVNPDDRERFEKEVLRSTFFWTVQPKYINFKEEQCVSEKDSFFGSIFVKPSNIFNSGYYLLIDGIPYQLDNYLTKLPHLSSQCLFLTFRTGTLSITPNRETVQYNDKTIKLIIEKNAKIIVEAKKIIQKEIDKSKTYIEAFFKIATFAESEHKEVWEFLRNNNASYYSFNGKKLESKLPFNCLKISRVNHNKFYENNREKNEVHHFHPNMIGCPFYLLDCFSLQKPRDATIFAKHETFYIIEFCVKNLWKFYHSDKLTITEKVKLQQSMDDAKIELEKFKKLGLSYRKYSSLSKTNIKRQQTEKEKREIFARIIKKPDRYYSPSNPSYKIEMNTCRIYPDMNFDKTKTAYQIIPTKKLKDETALKKQKSWAFFLNRQFEITIYFVHERFEEDIKNRLPTFDEFMKTFDKNKIQEIVDNNFFENKSLPNIRLLSKLNFKNGIAKSFKIVSEINKQNNRTRYTYRSGRHYTPIDFTKDYPPSTELVKACKEIQELTNKYPLLKVFDDYQDADRIFQFNEYIKLIDKSKKGVKNVSEVV